MDNFIIARIIHVLAVVLWIGGVAFVTFVLIPSLRRTQTEENRLTLFETLEGRFSLQAKFTTLLTGLSGFYMLHFMNAWSMYQELQYWWLHLMTIVWLIFTLVLFVLEPVFLHKWFHKQALLDNKRAFKYLHYMHIFLILLSLLAVAGAVGGAHGYK